MSIQSIDKSKIITLIVDMKIKAIIFDMDGIIIDSEPLQMESFIRVLKTHNIKLEKEEFLSLIGFDTYNNLKYLKSKYKIQSSIKDLIALKNKNYKEILVKNLKERKGLRELIKKLVTDNYILALASSSAREDIDIVIQGLYLEKYFTAIVSGEEVKKKKPAPDIFILTAKKLAVRPEECLVLEDSEPGVLAAKRARMRCIAVPTEFTLNHNLNSADRIVYSLDEVYDVIFHAGFRFDL